MVYEYSQNEKIIMAIITGISNFSCLPVLLLMVVQDRPFEFFIGLFTTFVSFMYHFTESLDISIYLEPGKWHALDNIGSICCFNSLIIYLMNFKNKEKMLKLNFCSLILVLIMQQDNPWDLFNTIAPIVLFSFILVSSFLIYGVPKYNYQMFNKGVAILLIAVAMFIKGLDEHSDYLRIAHSLWHITVGISTFYLWQVNEKNNFYLTTIFRQIKLNKFII